MSGFQISRRVPAWLRTVLIVMAIYVPLKLLSGATGFGTWIETTPAALAAYRVFAVALFVGMGVLSFVAARTARHRLRYRLFGALLLALAAVHIALLFTGASGPFDLFPE